MTEPTSTSYVQFTEKNGWEGETWHRYIPVAGNEDALERLRQLIDRSGADLEDGDEDESKEGFSIHPDALTAEQVDVLVKYANDDNTGYAEAHKKLDGILNLDGRLNQKVIGSHNDLYKLMIEYYMTSPSDSSETAV